MNNKPKLSILTISLANGGAERVISLLLKHLVRDFEVTLVLFYDVIEYDIPKNVNVEILIKNHTTSKNSIHKIKSTFSIIKNYHRFLKMKEIDISLAFLAHANIINGIMAMRHKNLKTIISERCFPSIIYSYNRFSMLTVKFLFPIFYNANTKLFSNSIYINDDLKKNFGIKIPMSVIYNPIELYNSQSVWNRFDVNNSVLKIITAGTMEPRKNQKLIIDALALLPQSEYNLTFLGKGPLDDDLKMHTQNYNLQNAINFKGRVNNIKDYYLENDCFVLSSTTEGFPNALLEALSVGLPSISTNCMSGPLEMLNNNEPVTIENGDFYLAKYGILVNVDDSKGLANAIKYFKEHPEERKRYSQLGLQRAKDFDLKTIYAQVKELLIN